MSNPAKRMAGTAALLYLTAFRPPLPPAAGASTRATAGLVSWCAGMPTAVLCCAGAILLGCTTCLHNRAPPLCLPNSPGPQATSARTSPRCASLLQRPWRAGPSLGNRDNCAFTAVTAARMPLQHAQAPARPHCAPPAPTFAPGGPPRRAGTWPRCPTSSPTLPAPAAAATRSSATRAGSRMGELG